MATDFIMPRLPDHHAVAGAPGQMHFYPPHAMQRQPLPSRLPSQAQPTPSQPPPPSTAFPPPSQQVSPLSTSNNASPTSPKSYHTRQLRPLFMPAVLRPTEHSSRHCGRRPDESDDDGQLKSASSFISLGGLSALGRLSRRSTGDSGKCVDDDWNLDLFPKPTAQPTRQHWKPDLKSAVCDEPSCMRHFNYWTRRHHCRRCGNIFCDAHSAFSIPLDQDANYNPRGLISRACSHCYSEFQVWRSRTNSQASSEESSVRPTSQTAPSSPLAATPTLVAGASQQANKAVEIAASVPRDWNWSTF